MYFSLACYDYLLVIGIITQYCTVCSVGESSFEANVRLERKLMRDYRKEVRPVVDVRDNVTITVGISLYLIGTMDDKNQMLTTSLWIRQIWHDPRLRWIPSKYSCVKTINLPANRVWIPDIKVYNEVNRGGYSGLDQFQTRVVVEHDGKVKWMGPIVLRTSCSVDIKLFPFDTQTCKMKIGSWTYDGFSLDVKPESYTMDISKSPSNLEWELVSTSVERNVQTYSCCPEPYPDVTYTITIKRRQQSYVVNFLFPALFLTAVTLMAFVTPGERVGLVLTCLVSMFFFLKMVAERTPSSDTVPLLSIYFVMLSFEITLIFYAVCISLNAYHRQPSLSAMSRCVRVLVMERLGRISGMTSIHEEIKQKLESLEGIAEMTKTKYYEDFESDQTWTCDGQSRKTNSRIRIVETGVGISEVERQKHEIRPLDSIADCGPSSPNTCNKERETEVNAHIEETCFGVVELGGEKHEIREIDATRSVRKQLETSDVKASVNIEDSRCVERERDDYFITSKRADQAGQSSYKNVQNFQKQPKHFCECESCERRTIKRRCSSFLNEMVVLNQRLISGIQEINLLARNWNYKLSEKKRWVIASSILDRVFFILFIAMFIVLSLCSFLG